MKKTRLSVFTTAMLAVSLTLLATGCKQQGAVSQQTNTAAADSKIAKIVFVGKKNACPCTRKKIKASWTALQKALSKPTKLVVERLQIDTDGAKVKPYKKQKAMIALPAIYFVDSETNVLQLLQGKVTKQKIAAVLASKGTAR
jgi:hypothetical protein